MELTLADRYGFTALLGTRLETLCGCGVWISLTKDSKAFELSVYPLDMYTTGEGELISDVELSVASLISLVEWSYMDRGKLREYTSEKFLVEHCRMELKEFVEKLASMDKERAQAFRNF